MKKSRNTAKALHADEGGAALVWVTVMILVIFGFAALAIDGARYQNLESNLQQIADAAALAGAKKLDGSDQAIENARSDAINFLKNNLPRNWSDVKLSSEIANPGVPQPQIVDVKFYSAVPGAGVTALRDDQDKDASFIQVTTYDRGFTTTFANAIGAADTAYSKASAVAKVGYSICRPIQSFLCNPFEASQAASEKGRAANFTSPNVNPGDMFMLGDGSGGSPGSWGFISPLNSPSAPSRDEWQTFWAAQSPAECTPAQVGMQGPYVGTGASIGDKSEPGMNVRFDNPVSGIDSTRAPVVTDGYWIRPNANSPSCSSTEVATNTYTRTINESSVKTRYNCSFKQANIGRTVGATTVYTDYRDYCNNRDGTSVGGSPAVTNDFCISAPTASASGRRIGSCPLPRDRNLGDTTRGGNSWASVMRGTGATLEDLQAYWYNHHTAAYPAGVTTRYEIYRREVDNIGNAGYFDATGLTGGTVSTEPVSPTNTSFCSASTAGDYTRRLLNVAIVDCSYWGLNGKSERLPIFTKSAQFFMTEPATRGGGASSTGKIYAEFVRSYDVNEEGGSLFQQIELVK